MRITFTSTGNFERSSKFLSRLGSRDIIRNLDTWGRRGVIALSNATPVDSGLAATSWGYKIARSGRSWTLHFTNNDIENGFPVIIGLQYGHGTGTGGWIAGRDFINPAAQPIFEGIVNDIWKEVTSA